MKLIIAKELLQFPRRAHRLVNQTVGGIVVDEFLLFGVEVESAAKLQCHCADVDQGAAAVAVDLVEGEFLAGTYALQEVRTILCVK